MHAEGKREAIYMGSEGKVQARRVHFFFGGLAPDEEQRVRLHEEEEDDDAIKRIFRMEV